jgi:hypothetical protein
MQLRVPREKGIRYLGFAAGIPGGRDGRRGGGGEGSQRSGMKDHGSGYIFGEWWIRGACMDTAVYLNSELLAGFNVRELTFGVIIHSPSWRVSVGAERVRRYDTPDTRRSVSSMTALYILSILKPKITEDMLELTR